MFCAIVTTIGRCKTEGVVDVVQVVKALTGYKNLELYSLWLVLLLASLLTNIYYSTGPVSLVVWSRFGVPRVF